MSHGEAVDVSGAGLLECQAAPGIIAESLDGLLKFLFHIRGCSPSYDLPLPRFGWLGMV